MTETLLFLCSLCILTPILVGAVVIYNLKRQMKGLPGVSGGEALRDIIQQMFDKSKGQQRPQASTSGKNNKMAQSKPEAEDAVFREVDS